MSSHTGFPWSDAEVDLRVREAIRQMWSTREAQAAKQSISGRIDAGSRGTATGGRHLDVFCELLGELVREAGFSPDEVRLRTGLEIPGFYRPTKKWDLVVVRNERLCAAVELKSMAGSYSNNLNNRSEEALGSATDVWAAYRKGTLGIQQPWLGYLFVIREEPRSSSPVSLPRTTMRTDPVFSGTSYIERYGILCQRMVLERVYTAAAYLASPLGEDGEYREPHVDLGFVHFAKSLFGHLVGCG